MILDACASGRVVEDLLAERNVSPEQIRALDRMKDRTGMFVLAGSAADKVTYEAGQFGQGLLTYSLLLGMRGAVLKSGIHAFHPEQIRKDSIRPRVYLTGFKVLNKPHELGKAPELVQEIRLPFVSNNVLSFEFAAVHFIRSTDVQFRHKLEGFESDWVETPSTERWATYTNLSPGTYTFSVLAANADGFWTNEHEGLKIRLVIEPPWHRTWLAYLLYLAAALALLFGIRRYELRRHLAQAEAQRLKELDLAKSRLYTNITHEFRTPLTVILGMEEQLRKDPGAWLDEGLRLIRRNGKQLLLLVNQLLDLAKLESGSLPLQLVQGDVVRYLHYLTESFHSYADSKDIRLHFRSDFAELTMDHDPEKLQTVVSNLLSNAIKFTPAGGDVYVDVRLPNNLARLQVRAEIAHRDSSIIIQISDTGPGIAPEHLPPIFDRFFQADDSHSRAGTGTGIGLALVKELVRLMGGDISVESEPGKGARFSMHLPVARTADNISTDEQTQHDAAFAETILPVPETATALLPADSGDRYTVLLVEDNPDVIVYLSSVLALHYRIETAKNGQEGIEKAFELVPDIIVSDVMMPGKDGFELCRTLKSDERSSHIPIVLLTAKSDQPSKIEGLRYGADAYLAKPFHQEELLVRLEKLIEVRRRLQERFQQTGSVRTAALQRPAQNLDDVFLQKIVRTVEAQMSDEEFGMPELCRALHMSRTNLFRKLKAVTGKTATDLIRSLRLEKAKELLETAEMNVTEVSDAVGFRSPNYFSRVFQEAFGVALSAVRKG